MTQCTRDLTCCQDGPVPSREVAQWFAGADGRNESEVRFLAAMRDAAHEWSVQDLRPGDTGALSGMTPLMVLVDVPGLPSGVMRVLQVAYWTDGPWIEPSGCGGLQGTWGGQYLLDDYDAADSENLTVVGVDAQPEAFATWAVEWLIRQLRRPVLREEWLTAGEISAAVWRLTDTGRILGREGASLKRALKRPPDRSLRAR